MSLTQKERYLLEDQKKHEQICIMKYNNYAAQATDPELKQLFQSFAKQEQQHYNTINQLLSGQVPDTQQQQQQQQQQQGQQQQQAAQAQGQQAQQQQQQGMQAMQNQSDEALCTDMLMTEKYVSSAYNTAIFEFQDPNARQVLNHIQKEEQQHGEGIFNYMKKKGLYKVQ
ncbi:MAG TPA: spore coat protein [Candidatus Atribacteria bacterium]|nr:spore coat protein [Candidatus Atribacteria bacterium]HPT79413.1 spore coat protein [Candidatus Atribacteria bacterium]